METKEYFEKEMFFESLRLPLAKGSSTSQPSHKRLYDPFCPLQGEEGTEKVPSWVMVV
jgi:hypothetical protein